MMKRVKQKRRRLRASGFTIIEIVAVLLVIGIVSATIAVRSYFTVDLPSESDVLRTYLRYAQLRSMNTDAVWYVRFRESPFSYGLFRNGKPVAMPGEQETTRFLPNGITINFNPQDAFIFSFDNYGRPCTDQSAKSLQNGARSVILTAGDDSRSISITENTGYIP